MNDWYRKFLCVFGVGLFMMAAGWPTAISAQVATPSPEPICRKLGPGDKYYPDYVSCCDLDGGRSRWESSNGKTTDFTSICSLWGIKPNPALDMQPQAAPESEITSTNIPVGHFSCTLVSPVKVSISSTGQYQLDDGSAGRLNFMERSQDSFGPYTTYRISGGSFDGFFFLHRDDGRLLLGRSGWTRCDRL